MASQNIALAVSIVTGVGTCYFPMLPIGIYAETIAISAHTKSWKLGFKSAEKFKPSE